MTEGGKQADSSSLQLAMDKINGVHMLTVGQSTHGIGFHPVIVVNQDALILVDAGMPGQLGDLRQEMERFGTTPEMITDIILTHQDFDHIGGVSDILREMDHPARIMAHAEEKPYIQGDRPFIKLDPEIRRKMQANLPAGQTLNPANRPENFRGLKVDQTLEDGEVLPFDIPILVVHTPGHTPGHLSLYFPTAKILLTGDALNCDDGQLVGPAPIHSVDIHQAWQSLGKLTALDIDSIICYHGGEISQDADAKLKTLVKNS